MYMDASEYTLRSSHVLPSAPKDGSNYHLVSYGPGRTDFEQNKGPWSYKVPCHIKDSVYDVTATMGDTHKSTTNIDISYVNKKCR